MLSAIGVACAAINFQRWPRGHPASLCIRGRLFVPPDLQDLLHRRCSRPIRRHHHAFRGRFRWAVPTLELPEQGRGVSEIS